MPKYPRNLLERSPPEAVGAIGVALLEDAQAAWARLDDPEDPEALHDFRVALRRLRSVLRAFRPYLDDPPSKKLRRRMRGLQRATNEARDTEVQILWVRSQREHLTRGQRVGAAWFLKQLEQRRDHAYAASRQAIERTFPRLERRTRKWLTEAAGRGAVEESVATYAGVLADLVEDHAAGLEELIGGIRAAGDEVAVHAARIRAKRLRYLLELVSQDVKPSREAVKRLKALQTVLGDLRDAQVVDREFAAAGEVAAAEHVRRLHEVEARATADQREIRAARRRNATPGMLTLARLGREAQDRLFQQFAAEWHNGAPAALHSVLQAVLRILAEHRRALVEIERKYLLRAVPEAVNGAESAEIEQGWLPGAKLQERLRRAQRGVEIRHYRTVKLGAGISRTELEEETTAELFAQLWPLTEGRRLRKRRHFVPDGPLTWEIDEFLDRDLVLAEVELPAPDTSVELPAWLAPVVEREVTGEPAYLNVNLAT